METLLVEVRCQEVTKDRLINIYINAKTSADFHTWHMNLCESVESIVFFLS